MVRVFPRPVAMVAAMAALALACACSQKSPQTAKGAAAPAPSASATSTDAPSGLSATAQSAATGLPASCQTLLASMQSCSDNLTQRGSPLGNQIRLSMTDMRNSIAGAPPAEVSAFCDTEAAAFNQRAQAAHC